MKRLMVWVMTLCLAISGTASAATDQFAGVRKDDLRLVDLGDFTIQVNRKWYYNTQEKAHNTSVFECLPYGIESADTGVEEIIIRWSAQFIGTAAMKDSNVPFWANWVMNYTRGGFLQNGWAAARYELEEAGLVFLDGRQALSVTYTMTLTDEFGGEMIAYFKEVYVDYGHGCYIMGWSSCMELFTMCFDGILESLRWKDNEADD